MSEHDETEDTIGGVQPWIPGAELKEGTHIDRYQILGLLGKGGMGAVYKAYDPELDRSIAIKILTVTPHEGETASRPQARLMREAQALAKLSHPNVVSVFDVGTYEEGVYIAMEYVKGRTLREWLREQHQAPAPDGTAEHPTPGGGASSRTPPWKAIIQTLSKAGKGIQAAHTAGIIHRDFKPENVIIGDRGQVKVLDFGLARAAGTQDAAVPNKTIESAEDTTSGDKLLSKPLTRAGAIIGTTVYMAPEHFLHQELDEKTDQFSFCVTLFEALYGKRPFSGRTSKELKGNITGGRIDIPQAADVPKWVENLILRGLSDSKDDRYASMLELLDALADDPEIAKAKRHKQVFVGSLILILSAMTLGFGYYAFLKSSKICSGAERKGAVTWNAERKEKIKQAFGKTGLSYANDSLVRVANRFDDYLEKWKIEFTETCEATRTRGEQSEEIMELKMGCLNRHLQNADALINVLGEADKNVLLKSVQAVSSLSDFSNCNDVTALQSIIPPPKNELTKKRVADIREKLAEVFALEKIGKYQEGLELARELERTANAVDYTPVEAEAQYQLGKLLNLAGDHKQAEKTLTKAARTSGKAKDAFLTARVLTTLVWVVGYRLARFKEAKVFAQNAEILIDLFGVEDEINRARLLNNLGGIYWTIGDYNLALDHFHRALDIQEKNLGKENALVASTLNNVGSMYWSKGESERALEYFRKVLAIREKLLGAEHPSLASTLNNMGTVFSERGEYDKVLAYCGRSLDIRIKALGPDHPLVAATLMNLAIALKNQGHDEKALRYYRKSLRIRKKVFGDDHPLVADLYINMGTLFFDRGEYQQALECFNESLARIEKTLGSEHPKLAWPLRGIGNVLIQQKLFNSAIHSLERLMKLCDRNSCDPEPLGNGLLNLARSLVAAKGDKLRAIQVARKAQETFGKSPRRFKNELVEVDAWLTKHHTPKRRPRGLAEDTPNRHPSGSAEDKSTAKR